MSSPHRSCQKCDREFSVFIRPYSCEVWSHFTLISAMESDVVRPLWYDEQLCNESKLCSNCARKFVLSYDPKPSYLRLCDKCCEKVSRGNQLNNSSAKLTKRKSKNTSRWSSLFGRASSKKQPPPPPPAEQSQNNIYVPSSSSNLSPPMSCTYCCSSKTQNKLMTHKFAVNNNPLKDQGICPSIDITPYSMLFNVLCAILISSNMITKTLWNQDICSFIPSITGYPSFHISYHSPSVPGKLQFIDSEPQKETERHLSTSRPGPTRRPQPVGGGATIPGIWRWRWRQLLPHHAPSQQR